MKPGIQFNITNEEKSNATYLWLGLADRVVDSLPLVAAWFAYPETHLPPGFGVFPPLFVEDPPGFNLVIFVALALVEAAFVCFCCSRNGSALLSLPRRPSLPRRGFRCGSG